ncbi:MAG TPA: serine/threonine-protein kinase, partial [Candidatus Saccharimonadia bacterium]|nr:serine/threonine-protein kinase [Candidatus Saccharimonadia bacterium]
MTVGGPDPRVGTDLGPYRIEAVIGHGGMGVVYRATDTALDRQVAIKLIAPLAEDDEAFRARFLRESKMAAAIDHPNIIPIYEAGERDGSYFLAMRFVDGTDLERRLRQGPLEPRSAVALLGQIASALDAAHAAGLVHRDVKPANVLVASGQGADRSDHAYLTDFGLTKQSGSDTGLTRAGGFVGTLEYIAPEQIEGKPADGRADQYALAGIAVACLTGQVPFPRDSDVAVINAHLHDPPPSLHGRLASLPAAADSVVAHGLAKAPDDRYPDCRSFVEDLSFALGVSATRPTATGSAGWGTRDRRPLALVAAVLGLGVLAIVVAALVSGGTGTPAASPAPSVAAASPTMAPTPSPTEDIFPNEAEAGLLADLPLDLASSCNRGPYSVLIPGTSGSVPVASLSCLPSTTNASSVIVREYPLSSSSHAAFANAVIGAINGGESIPGVGDGRDVRAGDCATSSRANGRWVRAATDVGAIVCYTLASSGDAYLWWTYDADQILVKAVN